MTDYILQLLHSHTKNMTKQKNPPAYLSNYIDNLYGEELLLNQLTAHIVRLGRRWTMAY